MAIKKHDSSKTKQAINTVKNELDKCLKVQNLPDSIRQKINSLKNEINSFDSMKVCQEPQLLTGHVATTEEVLSIITDISDYSKWNISDLTCNNEEKKENVAWIKEQYNVTFDDNIVKNYFVSCSSNNRNSVSVVEVTVLPGYFQVSYQTNGVGWSESNLLTLKEFKSAISANVD